MEKIHIETKFADKNGEIVIVELGGHVDQSNSFQLQKMFDDIIDSSVFKIIVDFSALHYMSSAGWGIFVGEVKRFRENGGDIKLASMNPEINDVFQMLEFFHILDDYNSVEEATASFEKEDDVLDIIGEDETKTSTIAIKSKIDTEAEELEFPDAAADEEEEHEEHEDSSNNKPESAEVIEMVSKTPPLSKKYIEEFIPYPIKGNVKLDELPLAEKIKSVVSENPLVSPLQIKKILSHEHFGHTQISIFRLWKLLRDLDLNSKEKRYRYYRSC